MIYDRDLDIVLDLTSDGMGYGGDSRSRNPLSAAVSVNFLEAAALLIRRGADPLFQPGVMNPVWSPLQVALMARFSDGGGWIREGVEIGTPFDEMVSLLVGAVKPGQKDEFRKQVSAVQHVPEEVKRQMIDDMAYSPPSLRGAEHRGKVFRGEGL